MPGPVVELRRRDNLDNVDTVGSEVIPPDPNGDVGPNDYVQTVNLSLERVQQIHRHAARPGRVFAEFIHGIRRVVRGRTQ